MTSTENNIELKINLSIESDWDSFNLIEKELLFKAKDAVSNAYAPYSNFKVGAAVLLDNNLIVCGNNQENATYPNGLCAERVALFNASSNYPENEILAIALTIDFSDKGINEPVFPCGGCRQSILEYEDRWNNDIKLYIIGPSNEVVVINSVKDILPFAFSSTVLKT